MLMLPFNFASLDILSGRVSVQIFKLFVSIWITLVDTRITRGGVGGGDWGPVNRCNSTTSLWCLF